MLGRLVAPLMKSSAGKRLLAAAIPVSADRPIMQRWMQAPVEENVDYSTVSVLKNPNGVVEIKLNRPKQRNAFNMQMWEDLRNVFNHLDATNSARCVVLSGEGASFSAGMDLAVFPELAALGMQTTCDGRRREQLMRVIREFQNVISAPERCRVPVVASIHGACIGGAVDLITACDIRLVSSDAKFSVKEVDLGIVADIGTLQRLPFAVGEQRARELTYTGRTFSGNEAKEYGLALETYETPEETYKAALTLANTIASKSPLTVRGAKSSLNYSRDHPTSDGLEHIATLNASLLQSSDLDEAMAAAMAKREPDYPLT
eukprot:g3988.t1